MADLREQFPDYSTQWKKTSVAEPDLEKPFLDTPETDNCYGLDKDGRMAADENKRARRQLICASLLCFTFLIGELIGGYLANSLAIMTDAAHLLSDIAGFMISLSSMYLANKPASDTHSFGYHRAEILGSLVSVLLIWLLTGIIVYEAIGRFQTPEAVNGKLMFFVALGGLLVNFSMGMVLMQSGHTHSHGGLPSGHGHSHGDGGHGGHGDDEEESEKEDERKELEFVTPSFPSRGGLIAQSPAVPGLRLSQSHSEEHGHDHHGHEHGDIEKGQKQNEPAKKKKKANINVQAALIHVVGDAIQSLGVMFAAALVWYNPQWNLADPLCSFVFAILVLFTTLRLVYQASQILMEAIPEDIKPDQVRKDLKAISGVLEVHDLHIWSLTVGKPALSVHLLVDERAKEVLQTATTVCSNHHIHHVTIQVEIEGKQGQCIQE